MGLFSKHPASTNRKTWFSWSRAKVDILKLDHNFLYENGAILTPAKIPKGTSEKESKEAASTNDGIRSIAAVFKWFEDNADERIVVAGHADSSDNEGGAKEHYELTGKRAKTVVSLLTGDRSEWAKICAANHQVRDYQLFLKYFSYRRYGPAKEVKLGCDPWKIDNIWGDRTRGGLRNFCVAFNANFGPGKKFNNLVSKDTAVLPTSTIVGDTHKDDKHFCTSEVLWKAFFDLLCLDLCSLIGNGITLEQLKTRRNELKFADDRHKFVSCGTSTPLKGLDDDKKSKYDPEPGRGVEVIFFDKDDVPGKKENGVMRIKCPDVVDKAHEAKLCPIFYKYHLKANFFDHRCLDLVTYHLEFMYYDGVKAEWRYVPEGLKIGAYSRNNAGAKQDINDVVSDFNKGVYAVKVIVDENRKNVFFSFKTADPANADNRTWVFTENKDATPKIVVKKKTEVDGLAFTERIKYYDLPLEWSSENYWTRYDMDMKKGDRYEEVMKLKKFKPYGGQVTISSKPLMFSLDDIVLAKSNRSCRIRDRNKANNQFPANAPLDDKSRYTLFYIDCKTKENYAGANKNMQRLKIHNTNANPDQPFFTDVPFKENLITDVPGYARVVYFCNEFYDVYDKRTLSTDPSFDFKKSHVLGARMALVNDAEVHGSHAVDCNIAADRANTYATGGAGVGDCGYYELHYFHNCAVLDGKPLNYLIIYWNNRLKISSNTDPWGRPVTPGIADDVSDHRKFGMKNAMERLNKDYLIEKKSGPNDIFIRPFHFMEAKNDTNGGAHKNMTSVVRGYPGGVAWMRRADSHFRSGVKADGSRYGDWEADPGYFPDFGNFPDSDGQTYAALTNHHEMGHATGNLDDYLYDLSAAGATWRDLPTYSQPNTAPGGPYTCDNCGRMNRNASPRLREFWKFVCWLHDASQAGNQPHKVLNKFFTGTRFRINFRVYNPPKDFTHKFDLDDAFKNVFQPGHSGLNQTMQGDADADLLLYKMGDDETSRIIKDGENFKGILVVRTKMAFCYFNGAAGNWTAANAIAWTQAFNNRVLQTLNKKFHLIQANQDANDYSNWDNIYVHFVPHYDVYAGGGGHAGAHIHIDVTRNNGNSFTPNAVATTLAECDNGTNATMGGIHRNIMRFCFGLAAGANDPNKNNFPGIVTWINGLGLAGGNFTMENL